MENGFIVFGVILIAIQMLSWVTFLSQHFYSRSYATPLSLLEIQRDDSV